MDYLISSMRMTGKLVKEAQLLPVMSCAFQITAAPDEHYGEVVVMLVEGEERAEELAPLFSALHAYSRPKHIFYVPQLPRTGSGKPDRAGARALAETLIKEAHV